MYIGTIDENGMHHLLLEVISNSIDEYLNGHGSEIKITIDTGKNQATVFDDGRGVPFGKTNKGTEAMIDICTSLHSGGKFGQSSYSVSGGLHGIGLTAVHALSSFFSMTSSRDSKIAKLNGAKGRVSQFTVENKIQSKGTEISFIPDPTIFGKSKFNITKIEDMVRQLSYLTSGLTFFVNGKKFLSKDGLKDMIKEKVKEPITDIAYISGETEGYKVEIAFQFEHTRGERVLAFTNNIPNPEGGTHITGFKSAFTGSFNKFGKSMGLMEDNLNGDLMRRGITVAVSVKMVEAPVFQGQTKEKLMTAEARGVVSRIFNEYIEKAFSKKDIKTVIDRALIEHKAEHAAERAREAAKKVKSGGRNLSTLKDMPSKLVDCIDHVNGEIFLCEGNSAAGSATMGRDAKTQAIMGLRGKVLNTHDKALDEIVENKEIKDMLTAFGTGIGAQFNIHNLRYKRIIILADADVDGAHINVLLLTLFVKHLPELIKQGKVYVAVSPLYKVTNGRTTKFFFSTEEMEQSDFKGEITRFKGIGELNSDELWTTTMDPKNRHLIQITTDNFDETLELFQTLMGKSAAARRAFIEANDLLEVSDDTDFFGEDE